MSARVPEAGVRHVSTDSGNGSGSLARRARLARRRLPWLLPRLEALHDGLVGDKGGPAVLSVAEGVLVELAVDAYAICLFLMHNIEARGAARRDGTLRPAVLSLATYQNTLRLHLQALGLERRARDVTPDLRTTWKRLDAAPAPAATGNGAECSPDPSPGADRLSEAARDAGSGATVGIAEAPTERSLGRRGTGCTGVEPDV